MSDIVPSSQAMLLAGVLGAASLTPAVVRGGTSRPHDPPTEVFRMAGSPLMEPDSDRPRLGGCVALRGEFIRSFRGSASCG